MKEKVRKVKRMVLYQAVPKMPGDTVAQAAPDMLRYDHAYISEKCPGLVLFLDRLPTDARWDTFWFHLNCIGKVQHVNPKEWFTRLHVRGTDALTAVAMADETDAYGNPQRVQNVGSAWDFETAEDAAKSIFVEKP